MDQITSKELIESKEPILILDIRKADDFNEWNIKGSKNIDVYEDLRNENIDTVKDKFKDLPKDKNIITVCNAGITAKKASTVLESLGYKTIVLENGMKGWSSVLQSVNILEGKLTVKQIIRPGKGCLSYLIGSQNECFIIDPSLFIDEYTELADKLGFSIKGVIETHVHADHLSGAKLLNKKYFISSKDLKAQIGFVDLKNNDEIKVGNSIIKVIESPGHTDGSVCLQVDDKALLTGDTIFLNGVGRPDLGQDKPKGASILYSTLQKLKSLNPELIVLPAHFTEYNMPISATLASLLENNKALSINPEQDLINYIVNNQPKNTKNYKRIKEINEH